MKVREMENIKSSVLPETFEYIKVDSESEDFFRISATLATCWKFAYKEIINEVYLSSLQEDHWVEFLEKGLSDRLIDCVIAKKGDQVVGVSIFGRSITDAYPEDGEMISLYVLPAFIGKGLGHTLLEMAEKGLKEKNYTHSLICVFCDNESAIAFYEAHGFETASSNHEITMGTQKLRYQIMRKVNG